MQVVRILWVVKLLTTRLSLIFFQSDSHLRVFLLAMVLHPKVQAKAQEEIDWVVGPERLPNFGDRPYLPYVEAVYIETFRWRPVLPTCE
jgi:cytochrome P450